MPLLVVIGHVWPEPNSSAAGARMLSLISLFKQRGWQVIFASAAEPSPHRFNLASIDVSEHSILLNDSSFDQWLTAMQPKAVLFDRFMVEEQFGWRVAQALPQALRILDMEDVHALRHARHEAVKQKRAVTLEDLNSELAFREIAAIYRCDMSLVISEAELEVLEQHYRVPRSLMTYCPFWTQGPLLQVPSFEERQDFISIGNFRHAPNWDAVLWLKQQLWPRIRAQLPQANLQVFGAYPPPKATALHNPREGFLVRGWAADAQTVMMQSKVCLAPLRFGAGLKGKLLDAMQCGTPSVTTSIGAEGMLLPTGWPGTVTDDPDDFANAACQLYQDAPLWQYAQQQGYATLQQRFSLDQASNVWQHLTSLFEASAADRHTSRASNFTGQMLQSHAYRSTRYMGQWIEAKNRKSL